MRTLSVAQDMHDSALIQQGSNIVWYNIANACVAAAVDFTAGDYIPQRHTMAQGKSFAFLCCSRNAFSKYISQNGPETVLRVGILKADFA